MSISKVFEINEIIYIKNVMFTYNERISLNHGKVNYFSKIYKERFLITKELGSNKQFT